MERKEYIDALKGIAICGIVAVHSGLGHQKTPLSYIGDFGANAVQLFFIISAYLTCESLSYTPINSIKDYLSWILKKIKKVTPLYYFALVVALIETKGIGNPYWSGGSISWFNIVGHLLFVNGFHPYWINSIMSVEWYLADLMILYAIMPFIHKKINTVEKAGLLICFSICFAFVFNHGVDRLFGVSENEILKTYIYNVGFVNQFQVMSFGILLYYFLAKKYEISKINANLITIMGLYILMGIMFNRSLNVTSIYVFLAIGFSLFIFGIAFSKSKIICNPVFSILGKYSFGIYLFHYTIIDYAYYKGWLRNGCNIVEYVMKYTLIVCISFVISFSLERLKILYNNHKKRKLVDE